VAGHYRWDGEDLLLNVRAQPRSSRDELGEVVGDQIKVRITAPPVDGKANAHLTAFLAKVFGVAKSQVDLVAGQTNSCTRPKAPSRRYRAPLIPGHLWPKLRRKITRHHGGDPMKTTNRPLISILLLGLLALGSGSALAENAMDFGDYVVHYNALGTDFLSPDVAKHYGITRSKNRAMINVSVMKKAMGLAGQPVKATVTARATNLNGQTKSLEVREIDEQTAIYYIAEFPVVNQETLDFTVEVTPAGETPKTVTFRQQFFTD